MLFVITFDETDIETFPAAPPWILVNVNDVPPSTSPSTATAVPSD